MHYVFCKKLLLVAILFISLLACHPQNQFELYPESSTSEKDFIRITENAVGKLLSSCNGYIDKKAPIIVTSLVNIDNIKKSSTYGRMSGEIISSALAQRRFNVKEIKFSQSNIFIKENKGEFALSRQIKEIADEQNVQAIIVGTYAVGLEKVDISLRLVRAADNKITCANCYTVPKKYNSKLWE